MNLRLILLLHLTMFNLSFARKILDEKIILSSDHTTQNIHLEKFLLDYESISSPLIDNNTHLLKFLKESEAKDSDFMKISLLASTAFIFTSGNARVRTYEVDKTDYILDVVSIPTQFLMVPFISAKYYILRKKIKDKDPQIIGMSEHLKSFMDHDQELNRNISNTSQESPQSAPEILVPKPGNTKI